jgi:hypothetical protein
MLLGAPKSAFGIFGGVPKFVLLFGGGVLNSFLTFFTGLPGFALLGPGEFELKVKSTS